MSNYRISTLGMYQNSLAQMQANQNGMAKTQQQLASGERMTTAADDPLAAGSATTLNRSVARLDQYGSDAAKIQNRLNFQENTLSQVDSLLSKARELTLQASNATLSASDRKDVSTQVQGIRDQILALANGTDGLGRHLFGGTNDATAPFSNGGGNVTYNGDQTQRQIEVSEGQYVDDTLPGSELFMRVRTGNGTATAAADDANTGSAVLLDYSVTDAATWNGATYQVAFTSPTSYDIRDSDGKTLSSGNAYTSGQDIVYGGVRLRMEGTPASGDTVTLKPSGTASIFDTLDHLVTTLNLANPDGSVSTRQSNQLQAALRDIDTAQQHFIDARAAGGAQLDRISQSGDVNEASTLNMKTTLSGLQDVDYAQAISEYSLQSTAYQAAQSVFLQMEQSSLFKMMS